MQIALIIGSNGVSDLNDYLKLGWKVINMCPMPLSEGRDMRNGHFPTCLVIIEKPETLP